MPAGRHLFDPDMAVNMELSLRALEGEAEAGHFAQRGERDYEIEFHYPTADDWRSFLERPDPGICEADPARIRRAFAEAPDEEVPLIATEHDRISVLEAAISTRVPDPN